jgi:hypothetical protein
MLAPSLVPANSRYDDIHEIFTKNSIDQRISDAIINPETNLEFSVVLLRDLVIDSLNEI